MVNIPRFLNRRWQERQEARRLGVIQSIPLSVLSQLSNSRTMHLIHPELKPLYEKNTQAWPRESRKISKPVGAPCSDYYPPHEGNWCYTFDEDEPAIEE